ncbi:Arrestin domain-containing protein A [Wickerhamomyces ciferrii]|uniref:Arrestin domain-containing protein A n=1 Tax=Wickerhamomyces ciferrii (strain ATCC 14091 / BCRC 22168 / CBS 111 / JCM 3599 / NBRC 0793 / NRRL Y-1031 F-60-10) TaxID=1206466 RepID=K0KY18_WICCF|nr:Arrestin domain-containing protein A [Wickerhamomyces ciferrii]CCH46967.1 Arrestin domain-containing protein A [Wickerhamomyces ciferrii]
MESKSINVTVQLNNTNGTYTYKPLDVIRGRVCLKVHKEINVQEVTVKFDGISISQVYVTEKRYNPKTKKIETRTYIRKDSHIFAHDGCVIFPPPNVRNVSNNKVFTLTPGEYIYDFAFKLPLRNICAYTGTGRRIAGHSYTMLPPSMGISDIGKINYQVKVKVKRDSWFRADPRMRKGLNVTSFDPIDDIIRFTSPFVLRGSIVFSNRIHKRIALSEKPTGPESYEIPIRESSLKKSSHFIKSLFGNEDPPPKFAQEFDVPFVFEVRCPSQFLKINQVPGLKIFLTSKHGPERYRGIDDQASGLGQLILKDFGIYLIGTYTATSGVHVTTYQKTYRLTSKRDLPMMLDLANLKPNPIYGTTSNSNPFQLELPISLYGDAVVPADIEPTFETCNLKKNYMLNIRAKFREDKKSWHSKMVEFFRPVTVLTGVPAPQEYIQMNHIPHRLAQRVLKTYPPEVFKQPEDFTPLYDDTTAAPTSLSIEETESLEMDGKQKLTTENFSQAQQPEESLPTYGSATQDQYRGNR